MTARSVNVKRPAPGLDLGRRRGLGLIVKLMSSFENGGRAAVWAPSGSGALSALVAGVSRAVFVSADGEVEEMTPEDAAAALRDSAPPLVCHAPQLARRLGLPRLAALDLLELFAFARPAAFCVPTPKGLAQALGLAVPRGLEGEALALHEAARRLLAELASPRLVHGAQAAGLAAVMARGGWLWGEMVQEALAGGDWRVGKAEQAKALALWERIAEWAEHGREPPPGNEGVAPEEARARLKALLGARAEERPEQADYAGAAAAAFAPRDEAERPNLVLAEAGTGVGKTLGYIAPASLWSERNGGAVWLSTFTRNLQRQIDRELDRLYPDPRTKAERAVLRKGRENYLCLLNFEEAANRAALMPGERVALGLMARWAEASRDGDMVGGDFPAWLVGLLGARLSLELTDKRGECIYAACPHYRACFIEKSQRLARRADLVIANHALVMVQAALSAFGTEDERGLPLRYVFDEGHHLFDAADSAFSALLSGAEAYELRRWILGPERARRRSLFGRSRGLQSRAGDLVEGREGAMRALEETLRAARALPAAGWQERIAGAAPQGPAERFLARVRGQVLARARDAEGPYSIETETTPLVPGLADAAVDLATALAALERPMTALAAALAQRLEDEAESLDSAVRVRIEAACRGLLRRGRDQLGAWRAMLESLLEPGEPDGPAGAPEGVVDWFAVERSEGRERDVGMHRHAVDPMAPFAEVVLKRAHGVLVTSATLRDGTGDPEADWAAAETRTGARHLSELPFRVALPSPFDYAARTRVFIVRDVPKGDADKVAAAYRALFLAAGGGALGLFTAIARLRAVHQRIAPALEQAGLSLYAQHVDALDTTTLVEIFRAEENACLLGTDAVRDGVDVPGRSLRLIVFDRVPWPRADILHRARRQAFGGARYDDMLTRLKLKQAFGRLVRRADDAGVFVLLDAMMPSRLLGAFPNGVVVARVGLKEAVAGVREFVKERPAA